MKVQYIRLWAFKHDANLILTKYTTYFSEEKEEIPMSSGAMLAMYTIGMIFGHSVS